MHFSWTFLPDNAFETEVDTFASELSNKHQENLDFSARPNQGDIYDT
jgi:hypothetical protein